MDFNDRHIAFLSALNTFGCLDTLYAHFHYFPHRSLRRTQQITSQLACEGYTFVAKIFASFVSGNNKAPTTIRVPALSFLTPAGAEALFDCTGEEPFRVLRSSPQAHTLLHRSELVKVRLAFDRSLADNGMGIPDWILESDSRDDLPTGKASKTPPNQRSVLYHSFEDGSRKFSCRPDAACFFTVRATQFFVFWEHDRSTEGRKQITRKARGLNALLQQQAFRRYWPDLESADKLRLFWTVPSTERIKTIRSALQDYPTVLGRSRFLIRPKDDEIGADGIDTRQLVSDPLFYLPDGTMTSLA